MEDVITLPPPPSRFFPDDLEVFARPPPPVPLPFVVLPSDDLRRPNLLLVAASAPSIRLFLPLSKTLFNLAGTLVLPDLPISHSPNLYALPSSNTLLLLPPAAVPPERARAVAKALLGAVRPETVVILDSIRSGNFRGRSSVDEAVAFKLETAAQRGAASVVAVEYLPSGSVMDGLGAALLGECEVRKVKATLVGTWHYKAADSGVVGLLGSLLRRDVLPELGAFLLDGVRSSGLESSLLYA